MMTPVLLSSMSSSMSPISLNSALLDNGPSSPRGRKRTNDSLDGHLFSKRHSNSDLSDDDSASTPRKGSPGVDDERRAHHNELERRRRDHIKDHFMCLKEAIPLLEGEKSSRALILKRAVEYIGLMQSRLREHQAAIDELKRRNEQLSSNLIEKSSVTAASVPTAPVAAPEAVLPPMISVPTTSTAPLTIDPIVKPVPVVTTTSSFAPVVPSARLSPIRFPAAPSTNLSDLAMLLALNSKNQEALLNSDLASLISFNSLALKEPAQFAAPLLF